MSTQVTESSAPSEAAVSSMPAKTREMSNHHIDSTAWNDLEMRPDDIIISTYMKSGTTWMQQIVSQILNQGNVTSNPHDISPWVDFRHMPREALHSILDAQEGRRFVKTHLPLDALPWDPKLKYIFICRDAPDTVWSAFHHFNSATPAFYDVFRNDTSKYDGPPLERPTVGPEVMFRALVKDEPPPEQFWPYWHHMRTWWAARHQPNLLMVHFNDLKADLEGEIRRIAKFLEVPEIPEDKWPLIVEHCTFKYMKENAENVTPTLSNIAFEKGAKDFINKGTNSRWQGILTDEDIAQYKARANAEFGEECAHWIQNGGHIN